MKLLLDACVLYPTVTREMLLGVAARGGFTPLWSARILAEWQHAAARLGPEARLQAEGEAALMAARWPAAAVAPAPGPEARLWLPDAGDVHVLAAAVAGHAEGIVTRNRADFPRHILAEEGLARHDPDTLLLTLWQDRSGAVEAAAAEVLEKARRLSRDGWEMRALLRKARLPRLGKALAGTT